MPSEKPEHIKYISTPAALPSQTLTSRPSPRLLRQKRLRQLLPVEGDLLHVDVLDALVFDLDGELLAVFEV